MLRLTEGQKNLKINIVKWIKYQKKNIQKKAQNKRMKHTEERVRSIEDTVIIPDIHNGFELYKINDKHRFAESRIPKNTQARI